MADAPVLARINELAHEEEALWRQAGEENGLGAAERDRLQVIGVELDQCYDLLHQRQGRREFGLDPNGALVRPPNVVERYQQ